MKKFLIILSLSSLFLCSCSTFFKKENFDQKMLVEDNFDLKPKHLLSKKQIQEDIKLLAYMLENGYGGRKYVPQEQFHQALNDLKKIDSSNVSSNELCLSIEKSLTQIPDMHLGARIGDEFCSPLRKAKFIKGSVGHNLLSEEKIWGLNYIKVKKQKIPVLSITTFPSNEDPKWNGFLDTVFKLKKESSALIIDLRGNSGGDDSKGLAMVDYLFGQDAPTSIEKIIKSQTPATFALLANSMKIRMFKLKQRSKDIPSYVQARYDKAMENFKLAENKKIEPENIVLGREAKPFSHKKAFTKPILVLIDKECVSSCESTLEALMLHPYAKTLGENSGGFLHFGNIGYMVLPNSQIEVKIATDFWTYKDGRYLEGIGYTPNVLVPSGQDALDSAKKQLETLLK